LSFLYVNKSACQMGKLDYCYSAIELIFFIRLQMDATHYCHIRASSRRGLAATALTHRSSRSGSMRRTIHECVVTGIPCIASGDSFWCPASLHVINRSILRNSGSYHEQHTKTNCNWRDASSEHFVSHLLLFIMRLTDTLRNFSRKNEKLYFKKSTSFQNSFFSFTKWELK